MHIYNIHISLQGTGVSVHLVIIINDTAVPMPLYTARQVRCDDMESSIQEHRLKVMRSIDRGVAVHLLIGSTFGLASGILSF